MPSLVGKRVLVAGGAGFIGSHLVDRLVAEKPAALVVVDNYYLGRDENLVQARQVCGPLRVYRLDASDLASMRHVVRSERISVAFNLAVIPLPASFDYPAWTVRTNIEITLALCELARCGDLETLVHFSSSEAYGSAQYVPMDEKHPIVPTTPYAASKAACDEIVRTYGETFGIDTLIVRPFNNVGPRQNDRSFAGVLPIVAQRLRDRKPIEVFGDGTQTRDYTYVEDTAEAAVRLYETERAHGQTVNVATGHELSVNDLVARILDVMGRPHHPVVHGAERPADVRRHCGDVRLLKDLTGFAPAPLSDERLRATFEWYERSDRE
jgi:UDP-glucose 4-epimerase